MALVNLLGANVKGKDGGDIEVSSLAGEGKVVGLYFSAHWCPPCRSFTPTLAKWYETVKKGPHGANFEVIFVSSDRDEGSYKEYFQTMPWLAVDYSDRDKKGTLSKKYKVTGIPTLVLLNAEKGSVITTDGRQVVISETAEEGGKGFPWTPKPFSEAIDGPLVCKGKEGVTWSDCKDKIIGLYFSAHWCGPCRAFTPLLKETYKKLQDADKNFEIIFVSSDRSEDDFKEYFSSMPWLALPYSDERKKTLSSTFAVQGIPMLIILDENGKVITPQGRAALASDPDGKDFPWHPKPVNELTGSTASEVNEYACLVLFTDGAEANMASAKALLTPIAEEYIAKCKESDVEQEIVFYFASDEEEDSTVKSLRMFSKLPETNPLLAITDIPEQKVYHYKGAITAESVSDFIQAYLHKKFFEMPDLVHEQPLN